MAPNKAMHKWTPQDRELLYLLKLKYSRKVIAPVFNYLLATRLAREGLRNGVSAPSLDAQFQEVKNGGKGYEIFVQMDTMSTSRLDAQHKDRLDEIEGAIRALGLTNALKLRTGRTSLPDVSGGRSAGGRRGRPRVRRAQPIEIEDSEPDAPKVSSASSQRQRRFAEHVSAYFAGDTPQPKFNAFTNLEINQNVPEVIAPALRISMDSDGNSTRQHPLLLFRATENVNTLRARQFMNADGRIPNPPAYGSIRFRRHALSHLQKSRLYKSPFMSFAEKASNSIGRVETAQSEDFRSKMFLVVFSFNDIAADAKEKYGEEAGPYLASDLKFKDLPRGYTGAGDWLVYGEIDCEPLLVLDASQAVNLARALRKFKHGDVEALTIIRDSLGAVSLQWREALAYVILRNYCGQKLPLIGSRAYTQLMAIVVYAHSGPTSELADFARLSVNEDPTYEEITEESITPPQSHATSRWSAQAEKPAEKRKVSTPDPSSLEVNVREVSTVKNLSGLSGHNLARCSLGSRKAASLLWSISPTPVINPCLVPEPVLSQTQALSTTTLPGANTFETEAETTRPRTHAKIQRTNPVSTHTDAVIDDSGRCSTSDLGSRTITIVDDDDDDWDFINDDLEASFVKCFPSAAKRVGGLLSGGALQDNLTGQLAVSGDDDSVDETDEEDDFVMPSIEKDLTANNLRDPRGGFLRGLTAHASSLTPPIQETPSKAPRIVNQNQLQTSHADHARFSRYVQQQNDSASQITVSKSFSTSATSNGSQVRKVHTIKKSKQPVHNTYPQPTTTVRTRVPVIIRKTLVDAYQAI